MNINIKKYIVRLLLIILSSFLVGCATTDKWSTTERTKEAAWLILHAVDWRQTAYAMDRPDKYEELNPILGKHPSEGRLNLFILTTTIGHILITNYIPKEHRSVWQNISIGFKLGAVSNNFYVGAKIKW